MEWTLLRERVTFAVGSRGSGHLQPYPRATLAGWSVNLDWPGKKGGLDFKVTVRDSNDVPLSMVAVSHVALFVDFLRLAAVRPLEARAFHMAVDAVVRNGSDPIASFESLQPVTELGMLPARVALCCWQLICLQEELNYPPPRYKGRLKPLEYLDRLVEPGADAGVVIASTLTGRLPARA